MKRVIIYLVLVMSFTMAYSTTTAYADEAVSVTIDGVPQYFEVPAIIHLGRTMLPLRGISEAMGFSVEFDEATNTATLTRYQAVITHQVNTNVMVINGVPRTFDVPSIIHDGRTLVPVRMITEAAGSDIQWNPTTRTAAIITLVDDHVQFAGEQPATQHFVLLGGVTQNNELIVDTFLTNTGRHAPYSASPIYEADTSMPPRNIPISPDAEIRIQSLPSSNGLNPDDIINGWPVDVATLKLRINEMDDLLSWQSYEFVTMGTFEIRIENNQVVLIQEQYHP
ncbi:MAG: copper amine oxidase N-terminal domain-containing protein [Defluviitaleaceae bacterium]|nr:copper amine oxidase N-terminal domain-containing protein [Defluviitaleaceae bacterium]